MPYDANGNMTSRGTGNTITWSSYNYPTQLTTASESTVFSYGPDRQYYRQEYNGPSSAYEETHYVGGLLEKVYNGSATDWRHHVIANGQVVAIVSRSTSEDPTVYYPLGDNQGSGSVLTSDTGTNLVRQSYGAFGLPRDGSTWSGSVSSADKATINGISRRGYTGHSMLGDMGLIHMNGRVQDAIIGRFLSPDPTIPNPGFTQSFNHFAYVNSNPLSFIDPSGFFVETPEDVLRLARACTGNGTWLATFTSLDCQRLGSVSSTGNGSYCYAIADGACIFVDMAALQDAQGMFDFEQENPWEGPTVGQTQPRAQSRGQSRSPKSLDGTKPQSQSINSRSAFDHYRSGSGTPLRMSFDDIDTSGVRPSQFSGVRDKLVGDDRGDFPIDSRMVFSTSGDQALFLGDITLRLQGSINIGKEGDFKFSGTLKAFDDIYDFNRGSRAFVAEALTWIGRETKGTNYWIEIRGSKPIIESGHVP
jgi:RHS repeat-associated protein